MVLIAICTSCKKKKEFGDVKKYQAWRNKTPNCTKCGAPLDITIRTEYKVEEKS